MNYAQQMTQIDRFLGLNEDTAGDTQLKLGESSSMKNFRLTENFKLQKRDGYKQLFDSIGAYTIRGMWYGNLNGSYILFFVANKKLYKVTNLLSPSPTALSGALSVDEKTTLFVSNEFNDSLGAMEQRIYCMNGTDYMYSNGTSALTTVNGYIPLVKVATSPAGVGTNYEPLNLLTGKKHQTFNADGTSDDYFIAETNITSVDKVYVNGVLKTATTDYTVDPTLGKVHFVVKPSTGQDNVDIYWTKGSGSRSEILSNKYVTMFGLGKNTRAFVYGATNKNSFYYSELRIDVGLPTVEYFHSSNFEVVGDSKYEITALTSQYDRLIVYTRGQTFYSIPSIGDSATYGIPLMIMETKMLNNKIGNFVPAQVQVIDNTPVSLSNGVYRLTSNVVQDERNLKYLSKRVAQTLENQLSENALTVDFEYRKEYWIVISNQIWVYNYMLDSWYYFELPISPVCMIEIDDKLYFGTTNGQIMYFDGENLTDNGTNITAYWESGFYDFGASWIQKYLNKAWISLKPGQPVDLDVTWESDYSKSNEATNVYLSANFSFKSVDFADFQFDTSDKPTPYKLNMKAKKFVYFKVMLESIVGGVTVLSINLLTRKGGASK